VGRLINECFICRKHEEFKTREDYWVYDDEYIRICHWMPKDNEKMYLGYYFIESKRHFRSIADASEEEAMVVGRLLKALSKTLQDTLETEHVYTFIIGDNVKHFHAHVVTRYKDAPREYWGPNVDNWPQAPKGSWEDIVLLNKKVRESIKKYLLL
jgi:diadenosine tetraphosphate (Ap4A) HIT family hydrolase